MSDQTPTRAALLAEATRIASGLEGHISTCQITNSLGTFRVDTPCLVCQAKRTLDALAAHEDAGTVPSCGAAATRECDQCGEKDWPGWQSDRCPNHANPYGSCDGTLKPIKDAGATAALSERLHELETTCILMSQAESGAQAQAWHERAEAAFRARAALQAQPSPPRVLSREAERER